MPPTRRQRRWPSSPPSSSSLPLRTSSAHLPQQLCQRYHCWCLFLYLEREWRGIQATECKQDHKKMSEAEDYCQERSRRSLQQGLQSDWMSPKNFRSTHIPSPSRTRSKLGTASNRDSAINPKHRKTDCVKRHLTRPVQERLSRLTVTHSKISCCLVEMSGASFLKTKRFW